MINLMHIRERRLTLGFEICRRVVSAVTAALVMALVGMSSPTAQSARAQPETPAQQSGTLALARACGSGRWAVKTGTDPDARSVKTYVATVTTILHLRSLKAPARLPQRSRIRPIETTVWSLSATLLRFRVTADLDYDLVMGDRAGRTLLAVIPAPACVGSSSPFLPGIRAARRAFDARFPHVTRSFQSARVPVRITGVGFFADGHGGSGAAPNGIQLHPVLSFQPGGASSPPLPPPPPSAKRPFDVHASVSPSPLRAGSSATLYAHTIQGAACIPSVLYAPGTAPKEFKPSRKVVPKAGVVHWTWEVVTRARQGSAVVNCTFYGQVAWTTVIFKVQP